MPIPVRKIRGHHLIDIANFIYEGPEKQRAYFLGKGYGEEFVENHEQICADFVAGRVNILIVDGLDDMCLANCKKRVRALDPEKPWEFACDDPVKGREEDVFRAGHFRCEIGKPYSYQEIARNIWVYYHYLSGPGS